MKNATTFNGKLYSSKSSAQRAASKFIKQHGTSKGVVSCPRPIGDEGEWGCIFL